MNFLWTVRLNKPHSRSKVWAAAVLAASLIGFVSPGSAPRAQAAFPGRNGRIAIAIQNPPFSSLPEDAYVFGGTGDRDIFTFAPSGGAIQQVTSGVSLDFQPTWSPDGSRILFLRADPPYPGPLLTDIYSVNSDGSGLTNLTNTPAYFEFQPAWSPDGKRIVFSSDRADPAPFPLTLSRQDLYVVDLDGGNLTQLTSGNGFESYPAWSPDGRWIAFEDDGWIALIRPDGSGRHILATARGTAPSWSPDGTKIAFGVSFDAWVINRDGSGLRGLTTAKGESIGYPSWSPDGSWISFISKRSGSWKLYKMRLDGSDIQSVADIDLRSSVAQPDWGPRP